MNRIKQKITLKLMIETGINQCTAQLFNFHSQNKDSAWNQWGGQFNNLPKLIKSKMIILVQIIIETMDILINS